MAKKLTPAQLREEAHKMMKQAESEEHHRQQIIGGLFTSFIDTNFAGFDIDLFKSQAAEIWENGANGKAIKPRKKPKSKAGAGHPVSAAA